MQQQNDDIIEDPDQLQDQQQPQFGQVEGEMVKLGGLDYKLLNQQKNKQKLSKNGLFNALKNKLNVIEGNVLDRVIVNGGESKQKAIVQNDKFLQNIKSALDYGSMHSQLSNTNKKTQIYLQFQLDEFGKKIPNLLFRRIGKVDSKASYTNFDQQFISNFQKLMKIKGKVLQENIDLSKNNPIVNENSDDDIFGNDSQDNQEGKLVKPKIQIEIGKKLNFGLDETNDIFSIKRQKPIASQTSKEGQDPFSFMGHKKTKKFVDEEDGYGECYYQSGPSLKDLVQMKKQGIQFYGDLKEFKPTEKKGPSIHKEYEMVKKIIEKKNKQ